MPFVPLSEIDRTRGTFVPLARNAPKKQEERSFIGAPFARGLGTVKSDFTATAGLISQAFGYDEAAQGFYNRAEELAQETAAIPRRVARVEDIKGPLDIGVFALETLIENAPLLASIAIPGLGVAKIAGLSRFAGKAAISKSLARGSVRAAQQAARKKRLAGTFAAFLSDVGLQTGESVGIAQGQGFDPLDIRVVGSGLGKGALDFVPILVLAKKLGIIKNVPLGEALERGIGGQLVERGFIRRAAGHSATLIAYEVPTEVAQEIINIELDRSLSKFEGEFTPEEKSQLLNAAGGAAAFGLLGIPAGIARPQSQLKPASEEELRAAAEATGEPEIKLLTGPTPTLQVTPEGTVLPPGLSVIRTDYDPTIDTPRTGTAVAQGVTQALSREQRPDEPNAFVLTAEGVEELHLPDPHQVAADEIRALPEISRTPIDQAIVAIDDARAATIITDTFEIPVPTEKQLQLPPLVLTLVQARDDVFLDPTFRRKADGQLTVFGKRRVATIDKRIEAITKRMGLPNPLTQTIAQEIKDAEKQLPAFNAEEDAKRDVRADQRLTPQESALLAKLEETAIEQPLGVTEEALREGLIAKREGEEARADRKLSAEEIKQLDAEEAQAPVDDSRLREDEGEGMSVSAVTAIVRKITAKLVNGPKYVIADSQDPNLFPKDSQRGRDVRGKARGAFFSSEPDRVYVFADRHANERDVVETVLHETLAHFGLRAYFTEEELSSLLETVYKSRGNEIQDRFGVPRDQKEALRFAEEFIAEVSENGLDQSFLSRIIASIRRAFRKIAPSLKFTDNDITFMLRDVSKFLSGRIPARNTGQLVNHLSTEAFMRVVGRSNMESVLPDIESLSRVWGTKLKLGIFTPLQIMEQLPLEGADRYVELTQNWSGRKAMLIKEPGDIANVWQHMPRAEGQLLAQAVLEADEISDRLGRAMTVEEEIALMKKLGASKTVYEMFKQVGKSFKETINVFQTALERAAIRDAVKDFTNPKAEAERILQLWQQDKTKAGTKAFLDEIAKSKKLDHFKLGARLQQIDKELSLLRDRNYFPRMRFGQYAITVRAEQDFVYKGRKVKGPRTTEAGNELPGEVVSYETFESVRSRNARRPGVDTQFKDRSKYKVSEGYVSNEEFSFLGMPPALFETLQRPADEGGIGLSDTQIELLKELYYRYSPGKAFLRHLTNRAGVEGYSSDALRVYSSYMMNAANHIARIEFSEDMAIQQNAMREAARAEPAGTRPQQVAKYWQDHFKHIMNPENDWAVARAWGFIFYLGFNVKSAFVNLTQVPMVAYPFLAHHYGDGPATAALMRAYKSVVQWRRGEVVFDNETDEDLRRGIAEAFLDESLATELAGIGESDVLQRIMPQDANVRVTNEIAFYGSFMFKHAEKFNREVVFIAARELAARKNPGDREAIFKAGRKAVQATMFEYKKWNRPAFMRGKKSVLFLFWQYMQHLSFMAYGGEGKGAAARVWIMLLFAAGLQGLPLAENFFDLIDFGGTQAKELLGLKDPKVAIRDDLRALARELTDKPDIIMHGWSRYLGLGPVHLLSLLGVPVPNTDISGSLSAGRVIPGTDAFFGNERDPSAKFGRTMAEVLGPVVGIGYNIWKALESDDPDVWKVWERALPTAMQGFSKGVRRASRGEETFRGGGAVIKYDPFDNDAWAENIAQVFSFATTRLNQRFELRHSQQEFRRYWISRQSKVKENFAWALLTEDKEGLELAKKKLRLFNKTAPSPALRIDSESLRQSVRERFRRGHLREVGLPSEKAFRASFQELARINPEGAPEL